MGEASRVMNQVGLLIIVMLWTTSGVGAWQVGNHEKGNTTEMKDQDKPGLTTKEKKSLLDLTNRIRSFRPYGTLSGHYETYNDTGETWLYRPYANAMEAIDNLFRGKFQREEDINPKAIRQYRLLQQEKILDFRFSGLKPDLPNLSEKATFDILEPSDLEPYRSHLQQSSKVIRGHREVDSKLHGIVNMLGTDMDKFYVLHSTVNRGHISEAQRIRRFGVAMSEIVGKLYLNYEKVEERFKLSERFIKTQDPQDSWERFAKSELIAFVYTEELGRQAQLQKLFTSLDAKAIEALVDLQKLQNELDGYYDKLAPGNQLEVKPAILLDENGLPKEKPLEPIVFKSIDPKSYVLECDWRRLYKPRTLNELVPDPFNPPKNDKSILVIEIKHSIDKHGISKFLGPRETPEIDIRDRK